MEEQNFEEQVKILKNKSKSTFTHARADAGGGGRKIGFNTNHYMHSHMRGRRVEAERTVGQRKKVTAVTFFPAWPRLDQTAQIRAKYTKFPLMKSLDFWCIEWM